MMVMKEKRENGAEGSIGSNFPHASQCATIAALSLTMYMYVILNLLV